MTTKKETIFEETGEGFMPEDIKYHITMKLVNPAWDQDLLAKVPHTDFLDLAIVYQVVLYVDEEKVCTGVIPQGFMSKLGLTVEQMHELAMENTRRMFPLTIKDFDAVIHGIMKEKGLGIPDSVNIAPLGISVLTNERKMFGAVGILYPDILDHVSKLLDGNLIIIPSSVHETILRKLEDTSDLDEVNHVVRYVNTTMSVENRLSDHVYIYDRKSREVICPVQIAA